MKLTTIWKNKEESVEKDNQSLLGMQSNIEAGKEAIREKEEEISTMDKQVTELRDVVKEKVRILLLSLSTYSPMHSD